MNDFNVVIVIFVSLSYYGTVLAWDNIDLELFDLVEDVRTNFYEVLGVPQDASAAEIRRAYRKLSLHLHPDRSDDPTSEEKFRKLVAVSEVLKDEEKRKRYDIILRDGLPDWRQPVFYYRRVRKMGFLEFLLFIFVIFTIGHFIIAWSIYLERKFELDEVLTSFKKKKEKRNRKLIKQGAVVAEVQVEDILDEEGVRKPTFWDLLPFVLYRLILSRIQQARLRREFDRQEKIRQKILKEEEERERERELENLLKPKPRRQRVSQQPGLSSEDVATWEGAPVTTHLSRDDDEEGTIGNRINEGQREGEWSEEDQSKLSRLMVKYPGGTPGRWEKVACDMGRSVKDITTQVKQTKSMIKDQAVPHPGDLARLVPNNKKTANLDDNIVTRAVREEHNGLSIDHQVKPTTNGMTKSEMQDKGYSTVSAGKSSTTETAESSEDDRNAWSQNQQKLFEKALATVAKDASDRWTQIARNVPGKSKEECVARYKFLVEMLKKRKRGERK